MKNATKGEKAIIWISVLAIIICSLGFCYGMVNKNLMIAGQGLAIIGLNLSILAINFKNIKKKNNE